MDPTSSPGCPNEKVKLIFGLFSSLRCGLKKISMKNIKNSKSSGLFSPGPFLMGDIWDKTSQPRGATQL